ncbi:MAG: hypothetical protein IPH09_12585 [bacterium]|nr:hypothetical protein [bacterium]
MGSNIYLSFSTFWDLGAMGKGWHSWIELRTTSSLSSPRELPLLGAEYLGSDGQTLVLAFDRLEGSWKAPQRVLGFSAHDVSDPTKPRQIAGAKLDAIGPVCVRGGSVSIATRDGLQMWTLTNGAATSLVARLDWPLITGSGAHPTPDSIWNDGPAVLVAWKAGTAVFCPPALAGMAPAIPTAPASRQALIHGPGLLSVDALGAEPLHYQWLKDGIPVSGATNAVLVVVSARAEDAGQYQVAVSNVYGVALSGPPSEFSVLEPPVFIRSPTDVRCLLGGIARFEAEVVPQQGTAYQWLRDGLPIAGATNGAHVIGAVRTTDLGAYQVRASNEAGETISTPPAYLRLQTPPSIVEQPAPVTVVEGGVARFTVGASGSLPLRYQWYRGETAHHRWAATLMLPGGAVWLTQMSTVCWSSANGDWYRASLSR